jgi:hypothetical protein
MMFCPELHHLHALKKVGPGNGILDDEIKERNEGSLAPIPAQGVQCGVLELLVGLHVLAVLS